MANQTGTWELRQARVDGLWRIYEAGNGSWHLLAGVWAFEAPDTVTPLVDAHNAALEKLAAELQPEPEDPAAMETLADKGNLFAQMHVEALEDAAGR